MEKSAFCFRNKKIMDIPPWFDQITNIYKQNYAAYKVSGNASHKAAYEWASGWMDRVLAMENASVAQDSERIKNFMESYETSNKNVTKLDAAPVAVSGLIAYTSARKSKAKPLASSPIKANAAF